MVFFESGNEFIKKNINFFSERRVYYFISRGSLLQFFIQFRSCQQERFKGTREHEIVKMSSAPTTLGTREGEREISERKRERENERERERVSKNEIDKTEEERE